MLLNHDCIVECNLQVFGRFFSSAPKAWSVVLFVIIYLTAYLIMFVLYVLSTHMKKAGHAKNVLLAVTSLISKLMDGFSRKCYRLLMLLYGENQSENLIEFEKIAIGSLFSSFKSWEKSKQIRACSIQFHI